MAGVCVRRFLPGFAGPYGTSGRLQPARCSIGPMEGQWGATRRVRMWREEWGWCYGIRPNPNRRRYQTLPFQPNVSTTRAQVREHLGFRECSVADADKLTAWLAAHVANAERNQDRVREELFRRCRAEQIEPPAPDRVTRIVRSAPHNAEETWFAVIASRVGAAGATGRVSALAGADDDDQDSVLALVKSVPGNVSLNSMLTEIRKLLAIRAIGLPPGLFADVAPKVVSSIWASATSLPIQMVYTYSWTPRRPSTSARVGPAERAPDWSCSASWCMRCQSAGLAAARVAMRHQPARKSSSAAKSTTGAWLIASSSVSNAATLAAGKAARTAVKVRSMCGWGRSCRWTVMMTPNLLPVAACHPSLSSRPDRTRHRAGFGCSQGTAETGNRMILMSEGAWSGPLLGL